MGPSVLGPSELVSETLIPVPQFQKFSRGPLRSLGISLFLPVDYTASSSVTETSVSLDRNVKWKHRPSGM